MFIQHFLSTNFAEFSSSAFEISKVINHSQHLSLIGATKEYYFCHHRLELLNPNEVMIYKEPRN
jgi:hypothetical protein